MAVLKRLRLKRPKPPANSSYWRTSQLHAPAIFILLLSLLSLRREVQHSRYQDWFPQQELQPQQQQQQLPVVNSTQPKEPTGCAQNPYQSALDLPLEEVSNKLTAWLQNNNNSASGYHSDLEEARTNAELKQHTRERFKFFHDDMGTCSQTTCVGGRCADDEAKVVCGLEQLQEGCIVYSIGGNNQWLFEIDLLAKTPCQVHTFDCTGERSRFQKPPNERLFFHHVCLGTRNEPSQHESDECKAGNKCGETWTLLEIQRNLGHSRIDLFKMDIEGFEWSIFDSWPELNATQADQVLLPHQLLVEFHYWTQFPELRPPGTRVSYDFKTPEDFVEMAGHMARMGYAVVHKKDGRVKHCAELTIMRVRCPHTGVYQIENNNQQRLAASSSSISTTRSMENELPAWFLEYRDWHKQQLTLLNQDNWQDFRYLIHRCHWSQPQCGGTGDRLKAFPTVLRLGATMKRLVFYHWDWPHPLEEFLTPTERGINWSYPDWLSKELDAWDEKVKDSYVTYHLDKEQSIQEGRASDQTVIYISHAYGEDAGEKVYNWLKNNPWDQGFQNVYSVLWHANFQLSPPIQSLLQQQLSNLDLTPGQYTGIHIRSKFLWDESAKEDAVINATHCAVHLGKGGPILVASDSIRASNTAVQYLNQNTSARAVTLAQSKEPLHIDRGSNFFARSKNEGEFWASLPSDFYDIFVDLYLLSMAKCMVYGRGHYGHWANLLSKDPSCFFSYFRRPTYVYPVEHCPPPQTKS